MNNENIPLFHKSRKFEIFNAKIRLQMMKQTNITVLFNSRHLSMSIIRHGLNLVTKLKIQCSLTDMILTISAKTLED